MIRIDTNELDKFCVQIVKMSNETENNVKAVIRKSALNIEKNAKQNLSNNKSVKTGHLMRGIGSDIKGLEATVHTSNIKYAIMVEKGTKPHIIKPKNKKALYWKGASRPVKQVKHPGSKAKPYLIPAFDKEKDKIIEDLNKIIKW